jgi:hypothetical protein
VWLSHARCLFHLIMNTPSTQSTDIMGDFTTKLVFFSNETPNDDSQDVFRRLQRHSKDKRFRSLALFLEECDTVIHEEALKLPEPLKKLLPPNPSVLSLADSTELRQGSLGGAVSSVLHCALQIGMFIG